MENKQDIASESYSGEVSIHFTPEAEKESYIDLRKKLIKLLYLIEDEQAGKENANAEKFIYGFVVELLSQNSLCHNKLNDVIIKINSLSFRNAYKTMTHTQIKRKIMESRGIVDHLINEMENISK